MQGNITIAKSWSQLNDWQVAEIAHLYLNTPVEDFADAYLKMILIVYQKSQDKKSQKFLRRLLKEVPISELEKHTTFLKETIDLHKFPEIPGLIKPADRIANITIRQFSTIDTFFFQWNKERSLLNLKRLVATLYRINEKYDDLEKAFPEPVLTQENSFYFTQLASHLLKYHKGYQEELKMTKPENEVADEDLLALFN